MIEIRVEGMSCGHCEKAVREAVGGVAPRAAVEIDRAANMVRVGGDADPAALRDAIREAGYQTP